MKEVRRDVPAVEELNFGSGTLATRASRAVSAFGTISELGQALEKSVPIPGAGPKTISLIRSAYQEFLDSWGDPEGDPIWKRIEGIYGLADIRISNR